MQMVAILFQHSHHIVVDLDCMDHKAQKPLGVFCGVDSRDGMLFYRDKRVPASVSRSSLDDLSEDREPLRSV